MRPPLIHDALAFGPAFPYMRAMQIPGHIDPVPVPRAVTPRADGRIDLLGLNKAQIRGCLEEAGLDAKQAKLRSKQLFHWLRSEEHTSELQSLMRISYAVFCL